MAAGRDDGEVEFLDVGPAEPGPSRPADARRMGRSRVWLLLALVALALAAVGFGVSRSGSDGPPAGRRSTTVPTTATSPVPTPAAAARTAARRPTVTAVGHPLLGVRGGWELVARGRADLVRIQFGRGRVLRTDLPGLQSDGPVSFVVGPDRVLIRPLDFVPGYLVVDGRPAQPLPRSLARGPIYPGPRPDRIWAPTGVGPVGATDSVRLLRLDGRPAGSAISLPGGVQAGQLSTDGAGGLLFGGVGGFYRLHPDGWHRLTSGVPLAIGPTRLLVEECDGRYDCDAVVIDQGNGRRTVLPDRPRRYDTFSLGIIAPDGRTAAIPGIESSGINAVRLVDLRSGAEQATPMTVDPQVDVSAGGLVWSPDSRWLFGVSDGGIAALDVRTGRLHALGVTLPSVTQLGIRPGGG